MNRSRALIRAAALVAMVGLLALLWAQPTGARSSVAFQVTTEPTPRPTVPPVAFIDLDPDHGVAGAALTVEVTGGSWHPPATVELWWDEVDQTIQGPHHLATVQLVADTFITTFSKPAGWPLATVGTHHVLAIGTNGEQAEAEFTLVAPSPTPTATNTQPPTNTAPVPPSATPLPSLTPTPSPTLRPITPMVTITSIPPTGQPPRPTATRPAASRTPTRPPGTATDTRTPSPTPGPGTPSATPEPTSTASPTPEGEIADTGGGWGSLLLWGFVLAGLVVAFRLLRVRGLGEPR